MIDNRVTIIVINNAYCRVRPRVHLVGVISHNPHTQSN